MTEPKKPLDLWIIALGDFFPPGVMETKDAAEMCVELTKSSNDPHIIHVREVMPEDIPHEEMWVVPSLKKEVDYLSKKLDRTQKALNKAKVALEHYSESFKHKPGFFGKSYVADMSFEAWQALEEINAIERGEE